MFFINRPHVDDYSLKIKEKTPIRKGGSNYNALADLGEEPESFDKISIHHIGVKVILRVAETSLRVNAQVRKLRNERLDEIKRIRTKSAGNTKSEIPPSLRDRGEKLAGAFSIERLAKTTARIKKHVVNFEHIVM